MATDAERRNSRDRRRFSRGGRREYDREGYSPLILVADEDGDSGARCEAILAALKFAVAPARSVDEALAVMRALRPNLVVARVGDPERLEREMKENERIAGVPVLVVTDDIKAPQDLVDAIRRMLHMRAVDRTTVRH
jgi:PleD family two-component response regulator